MSRVTRWGRWSLLWALCWFTVTRTRHPLIAALTILLIAVVVMIALFSALPALLAGR